MDPNEYRWKRPDPEPGQEQNPGQEANAGPEAKNAGRQPKRRKPNRVLKTALIPIVLIAAVIASILWNSFYELNEDEYAVITTLGKPSVVSTSGLKPACSRAIFMHLA